MKVELHSTSKIVELVINEVAVPARVWEGRTANGVACHAYIVRIAVSVDDDSREFDRDLQEQRAPSPALEAIPLRLIL